MAKFLVVHTVGKEMTLDRATAVAKAIKANPAVNTYWVRTCYARDEGKMYCEWDAGDEASVRRTIEGAVPTFPIEGIYLLDNEFYHKIGKFQIDLEGVSRWKLPIAPDDLKYDDPEALAEARMSHEAARLER